MQRNEALAGFSTLFKINDNEKDKGNKVIGKIC